MQHVGPYEIVGELGRGGMGVVYRARRDDAEHDVALKVIAAGPDASPEALARFQREARIATELDHPGIVKVIETGESDGQTWFAMELIEGEPLSKQIKERELTWQRAVTIVRDVADALSVAHEKGVLHRDIKPSNIIMDGDGKPHLTDFGLAKDTRTESKYTRTGQTLGTPAYMSPEQARGDLAQLTPASDVWALGCVLYELLSNRPAFEGDTPAAVIGHVISGEPMELPGAPSLVQQLLRGCLLKAPLHRYGQANALRDACARVLAGDAPGLPRPGRRRLTLAGMALIVLAIAGTAAMVRIWRGNSAQPDRGVDARSRSEAERLAARAWDLRNTLTEEAIAGLRRALTLEPARDEWQIQLGLVLWLSGDRSAARVAWGDVRPDGVHGDEARLYRAWEAVFRYDQEGGRRWDLAREDLRAVAGGAGRQANLAQAALAVEARQFADARRLLAGFESWPADFLRAQLEHADPAGDRQAALRAYARAFDSGWRFAWAYFSRGVLYRVLGNDDAAIADYTRAIQLDAQYAGAHTNRGVVHYDAGRLVEATADYSRAIELDPNEWNAFYNRGRMRFKQHQWTEAIEDLRRAVQLQPEDPAFVSLYGAALLNGDRPKHALQVLERSLQLRPTDGLAAVRRAEALRELGQMEPALRAVEQALAISPEEPRGLWFRAHLLRNLGRAHESIPFIDKALRLKPDNELHHQERALVAFACGRLELAERHYSEALRLDPEYAEAFLGRSHVYMTRGEWPRVVADLESALRVDPDMGAAHGTMGVALRQMGEHARAVTSFERFLDTAPLDDPKRGTVKKWLADSRRKAGLSGR